MNQNLLKKHIHNALLEDLGTAGDITTNLVCDAEVGVSKEVYFTIKAQEELILAGIEVSDYILGIHNAKYKNNFKDSDKANTGDIIIEGKMMVKDILMIERVLLNYLQHLSAIASITNKFVSLVKNTKASIYDTRKTIPGLRFLQKYAVICGGGKNHRYALDSCILIKDNHLSLMQDIDASLKKIYKTKPYYMKVIVECDRFDQVKEVIKTESVDIIMLDNMDAMAVKKIVDFIDGKVLIEASGGVKLENVKSIAEAGVDYISIGYLTHSAGAKNLNLEIQQL